MTKERSPQSGDKYIVRFPDGMRDRITEAAKSSGRSINGEILARLQQTFEPSIQASILEQRVKSLEVVAEAYRSSAESAYTATIILMERLEQLASELPKGHRLAQQTIALIELMRSKNAASTPINQDSFSSADLTHSVAPSHRAASASKK